MWGSMSYSQMSKQLVTYHGDSDKEDANPKQKSVTTANRTIPKSRRPAPVRFCRLGLPGSTATGRGIMSITGLSYGVVRVEEENSMSSLTLQDCGTVLPGGNRCNWFVACKNEKI